MCNGFRGQFLVGQQRVICMCSDCRKKPDVEREFSCTQYEQHCGAGAAKKWKASLRIEPGCVPEVPEGQLTSHLHHLNFVYCSQVCHLLCVLQGYGFLQPSAVACNALNAKLQRRTFHKQAVQHPVSG